MERLKRIVQINIVLGAWLVVAPFVMGYSGSTVESVTDIGLGVCLLACSWWILAADAGRIAAGTLELIAGIALVATPFLLHYQRMSRPFDTNIAVGILSIIVSATATWMLASRMRTAV
jgi:hypothetical protein